MNYNIISYLIYGTITIYIIYFVGKLFHRNGRVFILQLFHNDAASTDTTNNLLLMAYYLFNIGYCVLQCSYWDRVTGVAEMISSVSMKTGILVLILAVLHYFNMFIIFFLSKRNNHLFTSKT